MLVGAAQQYRGDGIAARGVSYNIKTARCDGNDAWAVRHGAVVQI
mgnify:CR=1 FL=1